MSFGKNRANAPTDYIQRARKHASKKRGRGARKTPRFVDSYTAPTHGTGDIIRLIPDEYKIPEVTDDGRFLTDEQGNQLYDITPFFPYIMHMQKKGERLRDGICSAGPLGGFKGKAEPCIGCDHFWHEFQIRQATGNKNYPKTMSKRDMWAFTVLVMSPFHKVEQFDNSGNVRKNDQGQAFYEWRQCKGRGCEWCAAGKEIKQGHRMSWSLGLDHYNTLNNYYMVVSQSCRICSQEGTIRTVAWVCQNPDCGEAMIEMATTQLSDERIDEIVRDPCKCTHCNFSGYLREIFECSSCIQRQLGSGERATLFDVDLRVKRVMPDDGTSRSTLTVEKVSPPKGIDPKYGEELRKPLPLDKKFAPDPIEKQRELFGEVQTGEEEVQRTPSNSARSYG